MKMTIEEYRALSTLELQKKRKEIEDQLGGTFWHYDWVYVADLNKIDQVLGERA